MQDTEEAIAKYAVDDVTVVAIVQLSTASLRQAKKTDRVEH